MFAGVLSVCAGVALADDAAGLWLTGPDAKGQVGHVRMAPCGAALCGTVVEAFDKAGKPVVTRNVGKQVIWGMTRVAAGEYTGRMRISQLGKDVDGHMSVKGEVLTVRGCLAKLCKSQKWKRLK
ncbi:DUF2147 domain-containing protein [Aquicoccus sp. G2-2]|uniref:DUF2147 domain-containing protein n=1 Tax=Aquicoccus sp. G2-2 TaxID=3092120 RepID=UPI00366CD898